MAVGVLTLVLFAFLAAVYLTREARDEELREEFRRRALVTAVLVGALSAAVFILSAWEAQTIWHRLSHTAGGHTAGKLHRRAGAVRRLGGRHGSLLPARRGRTTVE